MDQEFFGKKRFAGCWINSTNTVSEEIHVFKIFHMGIIKGISLKKFIVKYKLKSLFKKFGS